MTSLAGVPDASKVAWRHGPVAVESESLFDGSELESSTVLRNGDSDIESGGDSDTDSLQSAGVWSDVETVKVHLAHLTKLKVRTIFLFSKKATILYCS